MVHANLFPYDPIFTCAEARKNKTAKTTNMKLALHERTAIYLNAPSPSRRCQPILKRDTVLTVVTLILRRQCNRQSGKTAINSHLFALPNITEGLGRRRRTKAQSYLRQRGNRVQPQRCENVRCSMPLRVSYYLAIGRKLGGASQKGC